MSGWRALDEELARWAESGRRPTFWWRDDDAAEPAPELDRLVNLAEKMNVPIAIAAIPARAKSESIDCIVRWHRAAILQHGFAHENHAMTEAPKSEFPDTRPLGTRLKDIRIGFAALASLAGSRFLPVFVPPWNRMAEDAVAELRSIGLRGVSRSKSRQRREAAPGIVEANTHVDPIDWSDNRRFIGEAAALQKVVARLAAQRLNEVDRDEPTGILTHHRVQDAATWNFVETLFARVSGHVVGPAEVFALS